VTAELADFLELADFMDFTELLKKFKLTEKKRGFLPPSQLPFIN